jgi:PKD repeat protein
MGTANYGDGSVRPLAISGMNFSLSHTYTRSGSFTVTATVRDQEGASGSASATVVVQSSLKGVQNLAAMLASANLPNANSLQAKLDAAANQLGKGNGTPAANQIEAFANELNAMIRSGRVTEADAAPLLTYAQRVVASIR